MDIQVTVALLAYQQERIIEQAATSVLAIDYSNLDILFLDDGSTDNTAQILLDQANQYQAKLGLNHPVRVLINQENRGIAAQVAQAAQKAHGQIIVFCSGDDIQLPTRVSVIMQHWLAKGRPAYTSFHSSFQWMHDKQSALHDASSVQGYILPDIFISRRLHINGCTSAYTLDLFQDFPSLICGGMRDDDIIPLRSLLMGSSIEYLNQRLTIVRPGGISSLTQSLSQHRGEHDRRSYWNLISSIQIILDVASSPLPQSRKSSLLSIAIFSVINDLPLLSFKNLQLPKQVTFAVTPIMLMAALLARCLRIILMRMTRF